MRTTAPIASLLAALTLAALPAAAQDDDLVDIDTIHIHDIVTGLADGLGACVIVGGCGDPGA